MFANGVWNMSLILQNKIKEVTITLSLWHMASWQLSSDQDTLGEKCPHEEKGIRRQCK
jgi:hypothetical protein